MSGIQLKQRPTRRVRQQAGSYGMLRNVYM
jgi:hypothetical protein